MVRMDQYKPLGCIWTSINQHRPLWCTWTSINQYGLCVGGVPESLQVLSRARLASVLYTVMVVKSVLCCCGLALLLLHTNKTSRTPSRPTQNQHQHSPGLTLLSPRTSTTTALD